MISCKSESLCAIGLRMLCLAEATTFFELAERTYGSEWGSQDTPQDDKSTWIVMKIEDTPKQRMTKSL